MNNNQKLFCQEYVKNALNAKQAYLKVYKCKDKVAESNSIRLLGNDKVKTYISELQCKIEDKAIMSAIDRQKFLSSIINDIEQEKDIRIVDGEIEEVKKPANLFTKMKAVDLLNKMTGEYIEKVQVNGNLNNPFANITEEELKKLADE